MCIIPGVPKKFPDLSCYFSKSICYLIKIQTGIYSTMSNLDLSICLISVSAGYFLSIFSWKTEYLHKSRKSQKQLINKIVKLAAQIHRNQAFLTNSNSTELELHKRTQESIYLSVLSVKSTILLLVWRKLTLPKTNSCGPHIAEFQHQFMKLTSVWMLFTHTM